MGTRCICRCVPKTSLQAPNINATRKSRTTVQPGHLTLHVICDHLPKPPPSGICVAHHALSKTKQLSPPLQHPLLLLTVVIIGLPTYPHILCDTTTHHSQQTTANCPQHYQGCVAAVAVSQPFVSRALRSVSQSVFTSRERERERYYIVHGASPAHRDLLIPWFNS
jgi:hypothetical protein